MDLYNNTCIGCSKYFTTQYSTSFSKAVGVLHPNIRESIYSIYGYVRLADEIVDTFHQYPKREMLMDLREQTIKAIEKRISTNPIINSFQLVVNNYQIPFDLVDSFLKSMEMDIDKQDYTNREYKSYIYGSAEVVGLMCLKVFCNGNQKLYEELTPPARSLGEAFQKVNFLRDLKDDFEERGRVYFPCVDFKNFSEEAKKSIEQDISNDLSKSLEGIRKLPADAKLGVYLAYLYYKSLLKRINRTKAKNIINHRIRVPDYIKLFIKIRALLEVKTGLV